MADRELPCEVCGGPVRLVRGKPQMMPGALMAMPGDLEPQCVDVDCRSRKPQKYLGDNKHRLCAFCGEPTLRKQKEALDVGVWGGSVTRQGNLADFCDNPQCHSYGEHVATK